jgi:hypothetical protein
LSPPFFSVWFRLIHSSFSLPSGFGPPCVPHDQDCLPAPIGILQSSREIHTLSTGACTTRGSPLPLHTLHVDMPHPFAN